MNVYKTNKGFQIITLEASNGPLSTQWLFSLGPSVMSCLSGYHLEAAVDPLKHYKTLTVKPDVIAEKQLNKRLAKMPDKLLKDLALSKLWQGTVGTLTLNNEKVEVIKYTDSSQWDVIHFLLGSKPFNEAYDYLVNAYYNDNNSPWSDEEFDQFQRWFKNVDPHNVRWRQTGATVTRKEKEDLPIHMGGMQNVFHEEEFLKWRKKHPSAKMVNSIKLDGLSLLLSYLKGKLVGAWTRGNGTQGVNVLQHALKIPSIPKRVGALTAHVRGEMLMSKATFQKHFSATNPNARNVVGGIINRKEATDDLKHVDFLAYTLDQPISKWKQFQTLEALGFKTPDYTMYTDYKDLKNFYDHAKNKYPYAADGVIVEINDAKRRQELGTETNSLDPAFARAYKENAAANQVKVTSVTWEASKDGYLKPIVHFDPVSIAGVMVSKATGFNGKNILDNKINVGALIEVVRSGDVIPYIKSVIKPAKEGAVPGAEFQPYKWNKAEVDYMVSLNRPDVKQKRLTFFFVTMGVDALAEATIKTLWKYGFKTIYDYYSASRTDFETAERMGPKKADNLVRALQVSRHTTLPRLMTASQCFGRGFGMTKMQAVIDLYDDKFLTWGDKPLPFIEAKIMAVPGFKGSAMPFAKGLIKFLAFMEENGSWFKFKEKVEGKLSGKSFVFTGFRDKALEQQIEAQGGRVANSVSRSTDYVIAAAPSEKTKKAAALGITVLTKEGLIKLLRS